MVEYFSTMKFLLFSLLLLCACCQSPAKGRQHGHHDDQHSSMPSKTAMRAKGRRARHGEEDIESRRFRQVPLCVDEHNTNPVEEGLERFTWIFDYYKHNIYIPVWEGKTSPTGMITRFDVTPIKIDDRSSGYQDTLKNWVHIDIEAALDIEGLYVQSIGVPWGTPFGEFIADFDCRDCVGNKTSFYKKDIHIVPCQRRPSLEYTHPNVFTMGGDPVEWTTGERPVYFSRMHFNFRYTQYPCVETTYAQFLVIAVRSFKGNNSRFETFYSPIFKLDVDDNPIGAYYPFYYGWQESDIQCHDGEVGSSFTRHSESNGKMKLRYNQDFDQCILHDEIKDVYWYTCPPGPIQMKDSDIPKNLGAWRNFRNSYSLKENVDSKYGDDPSFCHEAGTWDWTVGDLQWPLPQSVDLILDDPDSFPINETVAAELPSRNFTALNCEEFESKIVCVQLLGNMETPDCSDYQQSECSEEQTLASNFVVLFGKDFKTGNYSLRETPCINLTFTEQIDAIGIGWGNKYVLHFHGKLMLFAWTVAWNVLVFCARFSKEYTVIEKRSSYFGIGKWLWNHMIWTYVAISTMFCGIYLMQFQHHTRRKQIGGDMEFSDNVHDLCNFHTTLNETKYCLSSHRKLHNLLGYVTVLLFIFSYTSGWGRPVNRFLRILLISYHCGMGYIGKAVFYVIILIGYLAENPVLHPLTFWGVVITDFAFLLMFILGTIVNCIVDSKLNIKGRQYCIMPEAIDTPVLSKGMQLGITLMLVVHIALQFFCFFFILQTFQAETNLCKT